MCFYFYRLRLDEKTRLVAHKEVTVKLALIHLSDWAIANKLLFGKYLITDTKTDNF